MLSVVTTALSTSRPTASIIPIIVRMLSEKPRKYIAARVMTSENGTAMLTIRVVGQSRRNVNSTTSASAAPIRPALRNSRSDMRMLSDWFSRTMTSMPCNCGTCWAFSIAAMARSATSTMLKPVALNTSRPTPGRPLRCRPTASSGLTMLISAISLKRTLSCTRKFLTSARSRNSPTGRTERRSPASVISPPLTEKLARSSFWRNSRTSTP